MTSFELEKRRKSRRVSRCYEKIRFKRELHSHKRIQSSAHHYHEIMKRKIG